MFPTHHIYPNPNTWKPPPPSLPSISPQASGRTATPPPPPPPTHKMPSKSHSPSKPLPSSSSPPPNVIHHPSPPLVEWNEYITVQSALQSFEDRFEEFMREQSRLLGEVYRGLVGLERGLKGLGLRVGKLEGRVGFLEGVMRGKDGGEVESGKGRERRVGKFVVVEGRGSAPEPAGTADEARAVQGGGDIGQVGDSGRETTAQALLTLPSKSREAKTDEEAWQEFLGFGQSTQHADLRPQHEYRTPKSRRTVDATCTTAEGAVNKTIPTPRIDAEDPQAINAKRSHSRHSGHTPAPQVLPPSDESGNLSMVEMLDQLGEELMGFERERMGRKQE